MHIAIQSRNRYIAKVLLVNGADKNRRNKVNSKIRNIRNNYNDVSSSLSSFANYSLLIGINLVNQSREFCDLHDILLHLRYVVIHFFSYKVKPLVKHENEKQKFLLFAFSEGVIMAFTAFRMEEHHWISVCVMGKASSHLNWPG